MTKAQLPGSTAYADAAEEGTHSPEFSDSAMSKMMDMIGDACSKMDAVGARLDGIEERFSKSDARMDAIEKEKGEPKEPAADGEESEEAKTAREDKARKDSAEAEEKAKADAAEAEEKAKADAAKKDGEESEKEKEAKADSVRATAEMTGLRAEIAAMNARLPKALSDDERDQFATIQEQADRAFQAFGDRAGPPLDGETPLAYKKRLVGKMQKHSKVWASTRIASIADMDAVGVIADQVYADAIQAARRGADLPAGHLRQIKHEDGHGHTIYTYEGDSPLAWMAQFAGAQQKTEGDFRKPN